MSEHRSPSPDSGIPSVEQYIAARDQLSEAGYGPGIPTVDAMGRPHGAGGEFLTAETAANASAVAAVNELSQVDSLVLRQAASATNVTEIPEGIFEKSELRGANRLHSNPNTAAKNLEELKQRAAKMAAESDAAKALHRDAAEVYRGRRIAKLNAPVIERFMTEHTEEIKAQVASRLDKMTVTGEAREMAEANIRREVENIYRKRATDFAEERRIYVNENGGEDAVNAREAERAKEVAEAQRIEEDRNAELAAEAEKQRKTEEWKRRMGVGGRSPRDSDQLSEETYPEGWNRQKVEEMLDQPIFAEITSSQNPELYDRVIRLYQRDVANQESQQAGSSSAESTLTRPESIPFKAWLGMSPADRREAVRFARAMENNGGTANPGQLAIVTGGTGRSPADIPILVGGVVDGSPMQWKAPESIATSTDPTSTPPGGVELSSAAPTESLHNEPGDPNDGMPVVDSPDTPHAPESDPDAVRPEAELADMTPDQVAEAWSTLVTPNGAVRTGRSRRPGDPNDDMPVVDVAAGPDGPVADAITDAMNQIDAEGVTETTTDGTATDQPGAGETAVLTPEPAEPVLAAETAVAAPEPAQAEVPDATPTQALPAAPEGNMDAFVAMMRRASRTSETAPRRRRGRGAFVGAVALTLAGATAAFGNLLGGKGSADETTVDSLKPDVTNTAPATPGKAAPRHRA